MFVAEAGAVVAEGVAEAVNNFLSIAKEEKKNKIHLARLIINNNIYI